MSRPIQLEFQDATTDFEQLPETRAEVTFIGRSNVGKSSLLNAIGGKKQLAPVSQKPGRTKALGCFRIDVSGASLVDCPGYGYAKVSKATRATWLPMLTSYLLGRETLVMAFLLVDGEIGPTASDLEMLQWLRESGVPHTVVATKQDKVKPSKRHKRIREFSAKCRLKLEDIIWVSAENGTGIPRLREAIREITRK
jgi:GTP-binding protein